MQVKKYCLFLKALICFGNISPNNYCDVFDGSTAVSTFSSRYSHMGGRLGYYNWNPTTVGSGLSDGSRKVETLNEDGWTSLDDFPEYVFPLLCSLLFLEALTPTISLDSPMATWSFLEEERGMTRFTQIESGN